MLYKLLAKYSLKKVIDYLTARRLFSSIKHGAVFVFKDNKAGVISFTLREENENIFMFCRQPPCWRADGESVTCNLWRWFCANKKRKNPSVEVVMWCNTRPSHSTTLSISQHPFGHHCHAQPPGAAILTCFDEAGWSEGGAGPDGAVRLVGVMLLASSSISLRISYSREPPWPSQGCQILIPTIPLETEGWTPQRKRCRQPSLPAALWSLAGMSPNTVLGLDFGCFFPQHHKRWLNESKITPLKNE